MQGATRTCWFYHLPPSDQREGESRRERGAVEGGGAGELDANFSPNPPNRSENDTIELLAKIFYSPTYGVGSAFVCLHTDFIQHMLYTCTSHTPILPMRRGSDFD